ncbi:MAG: multidrug efflux SMR transporter [Opitutales bacterium]
MAWIYLFLAGLVEVGWPLGFKLSQTTSYKYSWIAFSLFCMALSGFLLFIAQKSIPMGTSYAVWTSIGAAGTFLTGVIFFGDALTFIRAFAILLILSGVILLKLAH